MVEKGKKNYTAPCLEYLSTNENDILTASTDWALGNGDYGVWDIFE